MSACELKTTSNCLVYLVSVLLGVFSDQKEHYFQPVGVHELPVGPSLVEVDDPPPPVLVLRVLPVGEDSLLKHGVVRSCRQLAGNLKSEHRYDHLVFELEHDLDMVVEGPEVLHCGHGDDGPLVLFPGARLVILEKPQGPGILYTKHVYIFILYRVFFLTGTPLKITSMEKS